MNIIKKALTLIAACIFVTGLNASLTFATDTPTQIISDINDDFTNVINSIENPHTKEQILDLNNVEYLELVVDNENTIKSELAEARELEKCNQIALNDLKKLCELDEAKLDRTIKNRIQNIIDEEKTNSNILILPSSYEILEKYGFVDEVVKLKRAEKRAVATSTDTVKSPTPQTAVAKAGRTQGWQRGTTGYIKNAAKTKTLASYRIYVKWFINGTKKICESSVSQSHSVSSLYRFSKYKKVKKTLCNQSKALLIDGDASFRKKNPVPGLAATHNHILIHIECTNTGGFSAFAQTYAAYN